jgi:hypothetical protein
VVGKVKLKEKCSAIREISLLDGVDNA